MSEMKPFENPTTKYRLVYVYSIDDKAHAGYLKIGDHEFASANDPEDLTPNCRELKAAARSRIDQQTATAGVEYHLEHVELALRYQQLKSGVRLARSFSDKDVHRVLVRSGIAHKFIGSTKGREWFELNVETAKNAIAAVRNGQAALGSGEKVADDSSEKIVLREEQLAAITKTVNRFAGDNDMLWDAKMRFGKTLTALQLVKEAHFKHVLIATHRPVVKNGWQEDFYKLFTAEDGYQFLRKDSLVDGKDFDAKDEHRNDARLKELNSPKSKFIYFASIQDLRGSQLVGGKYAKNVGVFEFPWDLVIVDEAHEGVETDLGEKIKKLLYKKKTKVLSLSGTPFNILDKYDPDAVYVWDYVMEQRKKNEWTEKHPDEPNPYAGLPRMNIYTYNLGEALSRYEELGLDGKAFNFREFFRTWTGDRELDGAELPRRAKIGNFVHADDVTAFLDLISTEHQDNNYPYANATSRELFKHTLWMVPGVNAAKALSELLRRHPVFGNGAFGIANVAGEGDDYEDSHQTEALELVKKTIREHDRSITLSCGRLTTGVTVPEWTAVMMLAGAVNTSASSYMQTIFRVQSPGEIDGKIKTDSYVFDFAPDRTLHVLAETARVSRQLKRTGGESEEGRQALAEFLNYCPVVSISGTKMEPYDVEVMMRAVKRVFIMSAIKHGFDDDSIYNQKRLYDLKESDLAKFEGLRAIIGTTKQTERVDTVIVSSEGFDEEEAGGAKTTRGGKEKTPEQIAAEKERKRKREEGKRAASILRGISIRLPMLVYGADVPVDRVINLKDFVELVDDESWKEFMPPGVTKKIFKDFIPYYDDDVVGEAGLEYRRLAKMADGCCPTERVKQIAAIFNTFKNPDKETVLTPWRVVNMHLSDTIGGWCFFDREFRTLEDSPRYTDQGKVTAEVFGDKEARVLEINSKSGLYPLYVAYSMFRRKCGDVPDELIPPGYRDKFWREVLAENIFVICKTPMARSITIRTLAGYTKAKTNARYYPELVETLKSNPEKFTTAISQGKFWNKEDKEMKFDAVVGNPPYQENIGGEGNDSLSKQLFPWFISGGAQIESRYMSLITPSRWFTADAQDKSFIKLREFIKQHNHFKKIIHCPISRSLFSNVTIAGGVNYFLFENGYNGDVEFIEKDAKGEHGILRPLFENDVDIIISMNSLIPILNKVVKRKDFTSLMSMTHGRNAFGIVGKESEIVKTTKEKPFAGSVEIRCAYEKIRYAKKSVISKNADLVGQWKIFISKGNGGAGILGDGKAVSIIGKAYIGSPNTACSDSLIPIGALKNKSEAEHLKQYLGTKFVRLLIGALKTSQNLYQNVYRFVPMQDFSEPWTDEKLYKKYGITKEEQKFIESMIKPME